MTSSSPKKSTPVTTNPPANPTTSTPTTYWTVTKGTANRTGHSCRQCKSLISAGSDIYVRDGRKMRFFYHAECYSQDPDPRSQSGSTFNAEKDRFGGAFQESAPMVKGRGKWSTRNYGYNPK